MSKSRFTLNEGKLNYKLKFPFSEFVDNNILSEQVAKLHEPTQKQAEQGLQAKNNEHLQIGCLKSIEPTQSLKNQGLAKNFANPLQIGALGRNRTGTGLLPTDFKSAASTCSATSA